MEGIEEKRKPIENVDRTDRLRCCREQGTMGAGMVLTQRGQALLSSWSPHHFSTMPPPKSLPEINPSAGPCI